ncbi:MAG: 3'-5' exonuclease [Gammaproteobacteria bacterium]
MSERIVVLDFETTGLSPGRGDRATEIGALVLQDGQPTDRFHSLMNAGRSIPAFVQSLTGITDQMIATAPPAEQVMRNFAEFIGEMPLVAHNASFDKSFLDYEFRRAGVRRRGRFACSMRVARRVYPEARNHKLNTLARYMGLDWSGQHHRAMADVEMTTQLWCAMQQRLAHDYDLHTVPHSLMRRLQSAPARTVGTLVRKFAEHQDALPSAPAEILN